MEANFIKKRDGAALTISLGAVINHQIIEGTHCLVRLDRPRTELEYWVQLRYHNDEPLLNYMVFGSESADDAIWTTIIHNQGDTPLTSAALKKGEGPEAAVAYDGTPPT